MMLIFAMLNSIIDSQQPMPIIKWFLRSVKPELYMVTLDICIVMVHNKTLQSALICLVPFFRATAVIRFSLIPKYGCFAYIANLS